jgi:hypothetical protein
MMIVSARFSEFKLECPRNSPKASATFQYSATPARNASRSDAGAAITLTSLFLRQRPSKNRPRIKSRCLIGKPDASIVAYSFARIFRAMSCNPMRIKLLRRRGALTTTPRFSFQELILTFVFRSPIVGFRPQMTLAFIL